MPTIAHRRPRQAEILHFGNLLERDERIRPRPRVTVTGPLVRTPGRCANPQPARPKHPNRPPRAPRYLKAAPRPDAAEKRARSGGPKPSRGQRPEGAFTAVTVIEGDDDQSCQGCPL